MTNCADCSRFRRGECHFDARTRAVVAGLVACAAGRIRAVIVKDEKAVISVVVAGLTWVRPDRAYSPMHCLGFAELEPLGRGTMATERVPAKARDCPRDEPLQPVDRTSAVRKRLSRARAKAAALAAAAVKPAPPASRRGSGLRAGTQ